MSEAFQFAGNPDAIDIPSPADGGLDFGNDKDLSIMAWIQVSEPPELDGGQSTIVSKGDGGGNSRILFKIRGNQVSVTFADAKAATADFRSKAEVIDGKWHHVLFVADRDKATRLYIDGVLDSEGNASKETDVTTESPLFIGASVRVGKQTRRYFEGLIDEVGIYNRVLSAGEIKQNMSAQGLATHPLGKLALVWGTIKLAK